MVRTVDRTARRRALAEAVWRIVQRDGLERASVRSVARESGLSTGSVRHFFATQDELIAFAMQELTDSVAERIAAASAIEDPEERVLAILSELVPLDERGATIAFAHLQFVAHARFAPGLRPIAQRSFDDIRRVCVQVIQWLREIGRLPADVDVQRLAARLGALVDGLTMELLFAPALLTTDEARRILRDVLREAAGPTTKGG